MSEDPPARSATLADVARLSGVSAMTVSRVINSESLVRPATRDRVQRAMRQLRYRPNVLARGLATGRSQTIGIVTFETAFYGPGSALLAIERAARQRGYGVAITAMAGPDHESLRTALLSLTDRLVDGFIVIAPFVSTAGALHGIARETPIVVVEAGHQGEAPIVAIDQVSGARMATRHLLDLGHRTVAHVSGPPEWLESRLRAQGWREELTDAGAPTRPPLVGDWTARDGHNRGMQIAEDGSATAVFVANDQMALGLLHAFHERGVRVPDDVSVVGFDDIPEATYFTPSLTTVRQDFDRMGVVGVELLSRLIDASTEGPETPSLIVPRLIVRSSTGPPRAQMIAITS